MSILLTGRDTVSIVLKDITSSLATDSPASLEMIEDFADEIVGKMVTPSFSVSQKVVIVY